MTISARRGVVGLAIAAVLTTAACTDPAAPPTATTAPPPTATPCLKDVPAACMASRLWRMA